MYLVPTFEFLVLCFLSHPHPIRPYLGTCSVNRAIYLFKFAVDRACLPGLEKIEVSSFIWGCKSGSHLLIMACNQLHCDGGRDRSRRGAASLKIVKGVTTCWNLQLIYRSTFIAVVGAVLVVATWILSSYFTPCVWIWQSCSVVVGGTGHSQYAIPGSDREWAYVLQCMVLFE